MVGCCAKPSPIRRAVGTHTIHGHPGIRQRPLPWVSGSSSAGAYSARHTAASDFRHSLHRACLKHVGCTVQPLCMKCACSGAAIIGHLLLDLPFIVHLYIFSDTTPPQHRGRCRGSSPPSPRGCSLIQL